MKRTVGKEQYFTSPALAVRCVDYARGLVNFAEYGLFVEPSAGDGAFLCNLPGDRRVGIDIEPAASEVQKYDFFDWKPPSIDKPILTIGNPPFGQRASLAFKFLEHACAFSDTVAFILPRSFNKYTFQNRLHPYFHLLGSFDCGEFLTISGDAVAVRTVFQVWQRRPDERRASVPPGAHSDFEMRHAHLSRVTAQDLALLRDRFEFAIPQVGANFKPRSAESVTKGSYWFIRPLVDGVRDRFERLDFDFLDGMNTAHKSLSKRDIVAAYQAVVDDDRLESSSVESGSLGINEQLGLW